MANILDIKTPEFVTFVTGVVEYIHKYMDETFPDLPRTEIEVSQGRRYIKLVLVWVQGSQSVYGFVDRTNGDVLKAASWKSPAKHARGNIFMSDNGLDCVRPHGIKYL